MIVSIGTDIADVERVRRAIDDPQTGTRFRERVFTPAEIEYCVGRGRAYAQSFAARFAAKEAVMKALGHGFMGGKIGWTEIEVTHQEERPTVVLHAAARERAAALGITDWHLSLSHSLTHAIAYVIAEARTY